MRRIFLIVCALILGVGLKLPVCRGANEAEGDLLKSKELTKSIGGVYVLPDEQPVLDALRPLRQTKAKLDVEMRLRKDLDRKIAADKSLIEQGQIKLDKIQEKLALETDVTLHNQLVGQNNYIVVKLRETERDRKQLEEKAGKTGVTGKAEFYDAFSPLDARAEAVLAKYAALAADADVKAALDKLGAAGPKFKLGPSLAFTVAANQLKLWRKDVESESIPLFPEGGVNLVDVLLNGVSKRLVLDTGASTVTVPYSAAADLKITLSDKDRRIKMQIADGSTIMGTLTKIKTVRVGRFTMQDVEAVVLDANAVNAPSLLGGSFLSHFIVKLDAKGNSLNLIEISKDDKSIKTMNVDDAKKPGEK